ncbi:SRPBCC domain-containing protein [Phenylobacterium sp.]|uniref:SRPBCC family protein n=1 Tax=Phenylobacterium sp. TaxID=1871053 RepID=UPI00121B9174|nr:SRPBCC domain-containing protein [Phenylobacterium sp.]THD55766.1 MAG: SRPBCC domain-containing protein [Phenylobacterium sp.]
MAEFSVTHSFAATPEQVFDAWLDPAIARRFLFATRDGEMIRAEVDARVGGRFTFVDRRPEMGDVLHTGEYLEIDRPRRVAFTFAVPQFNPDFTRVTVEIVPAGAGCDLTLTQSDVPAEWAERSQEGWAMILDWLEAAL